MSPLIEDDSFYIVITIFLATICSAFIYYYCQNTKSHQNTRQTAETKEKHETIKILNSRKPLLLVKQIEDQLPAEKKLEEKKIETEQLEAIYNLMKKHSEFGDTTMDDMKSQMQLYGF